MQPSYFELFALAPRFDLEAAELDRAYRAVAGQVHPDRHVNAGAEQRQQSLLLASLANEAYRTLKHPVSRARYLLELRGVATGERSSPVATDFLVQQMEWREALMDARDAGDPDAVLRLKEAVSGAAMRLEQQLAVQLDAAGNDVAAADTTQRLMFMQKLLAEIDDAQLALET